MLGWREGGGLRRVRLRSAAMVCGRKGEIAYGGGNVFGNGSEDVRRGADKGSLDDDDGVGGVLRAMTLNLESRLFIFFFLVVNIFTDTALLNASRCEVITSS